MIVKCCSSGSSKTWFTDGRTTSLQRQKFGAASCSGGRNIRMAPRTRGHRPVLPLDARHPCSFHTVLARVPGAHLLWSLCGALAGILRGVSKWATLFASDFSRDWPWLRCDRYLCHACCFILEHRACASLFSLLRASLSSVEAALHVRARTRRNQRSEDVVAHEATLVVEFLTK